MKLSLRCAWLTILAVFSATSVAATLVIDFTATVTSINTFNLSSSSGLIGTTGQGHIEYDLNPDASGVASCCSVYSYNVSAPVFDFTLGGTTYSAGSGSSPLSGSSGSPFSIDVSDDKPVFFDGTSVVTVDRQRYWGDYLNQTLEGYGTRMVLHLTDTTRTALSDELLPVVPPDLTLFDMVGFSIQISPSPGVTTSGLNLSIDSLSGYVVPIPPAIWLFGSGLLGLIGIARRKTHS